MNDSKRRNFLRKIVTLTASAGVAALLLDRLPGKSLVQPVQAVGPGTTLTVDGNAGNGHGVTQFSSDNVSTGNAAFLTTSTGSGAAIQGTCTAGTGVFGTTTTGTGVNGTASAAGGRALFGFVSDPGAMPLVAQGPSGSMQVNASGAMLATQVGQSAPNALSGNQGNVNLPGTSSSSLVMCGMKFLFTPKVSGNLIGFFTGQIANTVAGGRPRASVNYGTGTPPNNGAANTGISINSVLAADVIGYGANQVQPITFPFSINSANNGGPLTVGTQYWFDVAQAAAVAGFTTVTNNFFVILEI